MCEKKQEENDWECSICLIDQQDEFGLFVKHQLKCGHVFHIGCVQQHFLTQNQVNENNCEFVLSCPLCRDKTIKNNFGVRIQKDIKNNQITLIKGERQLVFTLSLYGKDLNLSDIKKAIKMLQEVTDLCFDVDCYWQVSEMMPQQKKHEYYIDYEKNCTKLISIPDQQNKALEIERHGSYYG